MKLFVQDQLIEYADDGSGRVIFMLHGWGQNMHCFDEIARHLSENNRVIRIDFPGFGGSPKPNGDWCVIDYARITGAFIEKLGICQPYCVIAHSFGGRIVIKGLKNELFAFEKVVLIGAAGIKPKKTAKLRAYKAIAKTGRVLTSLPGINKLQPKLKTMLYSSAGNLDYVNSGQMKKIFLNSINEDLTTEIPSIKQPTLLIWGEQDTETPLDDGKKMHDMIKNSRLVTVEGAGHFVFLEKSDKVIYELDEFIK